MSVEILDTGEQGVIMGMNLYQKIRNEHLVAPRGSDRKAATAFWKTPRSDTNADLHETISLNISHIVPQGTWGASPSQTIGIDENIPYPDELRDKKGSVGV